MKRIIIMLLFCGLFMGLFAQLNESFESCYEDSNGVTVLPAGWMMVDNDEDGENWFTYSYSPHSGGKCIASASYSFSSGALTPDNWLITPAVAIPDSATLSWWAAAQDIDYPNDYYSVMMSTTGTSLEDFTANLYSETLTSDTWHQVEVDLSAFAGDTLYFAWRHHACTDWFYMKIDDVVVESGGSNASEYNELITCASAIDNIYPNPFNPQTTVSFYMEEAGIAEITVYNFKGQKVETIASGNYDTGFHNIIWNANTQPSGMYLFRLNTMSGLSYGKAMLMK